MSQPRARGPRRTDFFTDYTDQGAGELTIPADLTGLSDEDLAQLHADAVAAFDALYGDGTGLTDESVAALGTLTEGIEALQGEVLSRGELAAQRAAAAAELATRVHTESRTEEITDEEDDDPAGAGEGDGGTGSGGNEGAGDGEGAPVAVVAAGQARRDIRVNLGNLRPGRGQVPSGLRRQADGPPRMQDFALVAADGAGYVAGQGVNWLDLGRILDRRLASFNESQFAAAHRAGIQLTQRAALATFRRPIPEDLMITSGDRQHIEEVMDRATDQSRLEGGSLLASGGWCAPSEVLYNSMDEMESRDGLLSVPEIGVTRGGIQWTTGIDFSTIYAAIGWYYTEANDTAGQYAVTDDAADLHPGAGTTGDKPCYKVPCPSWTEARLKLAGLCLTAGLLQSRGYPEAIARTTRGSLVAHDHKQSARVINEMVTGSTAVTMLTGTVGTLAPLLTAIELQVEHYRYIRRMARSTVLEAVFPFWVRGAIRTDLALRQGLSPDESVQITDAQINAWFTSRGIAAQFVYDWQPITGAAGSFTQWPTTVQFLLYSAGTWVKGINDVITLDTLFDSTMLGSNDFTALFTEEGYLVAKRGQDSRVVTVPVCSNGATGAPVELSCYAQATTLAVDTTIPTAGTLASSSITATGFTLTVTGASDAGVGLAAKPYRFSTDDGATWSAWQLSAVKVVTGLTASTLYTVQHQVRDASGNVRSGTAIEVTTTA